MHESTRIQWYESAIAQHTREAEFAQTKEEKEDRLRQAERYKKLLAETEMPTE